MKDSELKEFILAERTSSSKPIEFGRFGVPVLKACVKYLIVKKGINAYQLIYDKFNGDIDTLIKLRNKSIIGHGFEGVSEEILKESYKGSVLEDLESIMETLGIDYQESPFDKINDILEREIERLYQF